MKEAREPQQGDRDTGRSQQRAVRRCVAKVRAKRQVTVPGEIAAALGIEEGDQLEFDLADDGQVTVRGTTTIPADQRWFWQADWQAGEREASRQIAAGETTIYEDAEAMFGDLER